MKKIEGLYAITDENLISPGSFENSVLDTLAGGAKVVQYRNKSEQHDLRLKQAEIVVSLCKEYNAVSIINDDIELAKKVNSDGVHIGIEDESLLKARLALGNEKIIGVSCYADIPRAEKAIQDDADYVAFGAVYPSSTKPQAKTASIEVLSEAAKKLNVPIVAIGGITVDKAPEVIATGVQSIAVISGIFSADDIKLRSQQFAQLFL